MYVIGLRDGLESSSVLASGACSPPLNSSVVLGT